MRHHRFIIALIAASAVSFPALCAEPAAMRFLPLPAAASKAQVKTALPAAPAKFFPLVRQAPQAMPLRVAARADTASDMPAPSPSQKPVAMTQEQAQQILSIFPTPD